MPQASSLWWLTVDDTRRGPFSIAFLQAGLAAGSIDPEQLVCPLDLAQWRPARQWPELQAGLTLRSELTREPDPYATWLAPWDAAWLEFTANYFQIWGPVLLVLYFCVQPSADPTFLAGSPAERVEGGLDLLLIAVLLGGTGCGIYGASRLRRLARDSVAWITAGVAVSWLGTVFVLVVFFLLMVTTDASLLAPTPPTSLLQSLVLIFSESAHAIGCAIIDVLCLGWLWKIPPSLSDQPLPARTASSSSATAQP